jgi:hypothetical protein
MPRRFSIAAEPISTLSCLICAASMLTGRPLYLPAAFALDHGAALLQAGILNTHEPVDLAETWRADAAAASLHAQVEPLHRTKLRLQPHLRRIEEGKATNAAARLNSVGTGRTPNPRTPTTDWSPPRNPTPFIAPTYRGIGTPAPAPSAEAALAERERVREINRSLAGDRDAALAE